MTAMPGQVDLLGDDVDMFAPRAGGAGVSGPTPPPPNPPNPPNPMESREEAEPQGSPCKRRGVGQESSVTVDMLKDMFADQTRTLLQHQAQELRRGQDELRKELQAGQEMFRKEFQKDVFKELKAHQSDLRQELRADKAELSREMQALNNACVTQFQDVQQSIQGAERGIRDLTVAQGSLESRLQALETRGSEAGTVGTGSAPGGGTGGRRAALVLGGWDPDTAAADMLKEAGSSASTWTLRTSSCRVCAAGLRSSPTPLALGRRPKSCAGGSKQPSPR